MFSAGRRRLVQPEGRPRERREPEQPGSVKSVAQPNIRLNAGRRTRPSSNKGNHPALQPSTTPACHPALNRNGCRAPPPSPVTGGAGENPAAAKNTGPDGDARNNGHRPHFHPAKTKERTQKARDDRHRQDRIPGRSKQESGRLPALHTGQRSCRKLDHVGQGQRDHRNRVRRNETARRPMEDGPEKSAKAEAESPRKNPAGTASEPGRSAQPESRDTEPSERPAEAGKAKLKREGGSAAPQRPEQVDQRG